MRASRSTVVLTVAVVALTAACGGGGSSGNSSPAAASPTGVALPSPEVSPPTSTTTYGAGEARVVVTEGKPQTLNLEFDSDGVYQYDADEKEFDLYWVDEKGDALRVDLDDYSDPDDPDMFVSVQLGKTLYPDSFHFDCDVDLRTFTEEAIAGTFQCTDLVGASEKDKISANGEFVATPD